MIPPTETPTICSIGSHPQPILPKGDRCDLPPGRGQFRLASLLWLLTISSIVLALGRTAHFDLFWMFLLLGITVGLWWRYAQLREAPLPRDYADAEALREEIARWKATGGGPSRTER